jgi:hypothetical protein
MPAVSGWEWNSSPRKIAAARGDRLSVAGLCRLPMGDSGCDHAEAAAEEGRSVHRRLAMPPPVGLNRRGLLSMFGAIVHHPVTVT